MSDLVKAPDECIPVEITKWLEKFRRLSSSKKEDAIDKMVRTSLCHEACKLIKVINREYPTDFVHALPSEMIQLILSYLEPEELAHVSQTCRLLRRNADLDLLWRDICLKEKISPESFQTFKSWKTTFIQYKVIEGRWAKNRPKAILKFGSMNIGENVAGCFIYTGTFNALPSEDGKSVTLFNTSGKPYKTLIGHTKLLMYSSYFGNTLATGGLDIDIIVWDTKTFSQISVLRGHTGPICCLEIYEGNVVSGSTDGTARIWHIITGVCLHVLYGHTSCVSCVRYDGRRIITASCDGTMRIWDAESPEGPKCLHILEVPVDDFYCHLAYDGVHIASSNSFELEVHNVETGSSLLKVYQNSVVCVKILLSDRKRVVVGSTNSAIHIWDIYGKSCLVHIERTHQSRLTNVCIINNFLLTSSIDGIVKLWNSTNGEYVRNLIEMNGAVKYMKITPTSLACIASLGTSQKMIILDFGDPANTGSMTET